MAVHVAEKLVFEWRWLHTVGEPSQGAAELELRPSAFGDHLAAPLCVDEWCLEWRVEKLLAS